MQLRVFDMPAINDVGLAQILDIQHVEARVLAPRDVHIGPREFLLDFDIIDLEEAAQWYVRQDLHVRAALFAWAEVGLGSQRADCSEEDDGDRDQTSSHARELLVKVIGHRLSVRSNIQHRTLNTQSPSEQLITSGFEIECWMFDIR